MNIAKNVQSALGVIDSLIDEENDSLASSLMEVKKTILKLVRQNGIHLLDWKSYVVRGRLCMYGVSKFGTYSITEFKANAIRNKAGGFYCRFYLGEFPGHLGHFDRHGPARIGTGNVDSRKGLHKTPIEAFWAAERHNAEVKIDMVQFSRRMDINKVRLAGKST